MSFYRDIYRKQKYTLLLSGAAIAILVVAGVVEYFANPAEMFQLRAYELAILIASFMLTMLGYRIDTSREHEDHLRILRGMGNVHSMTRDQAALEIIHNLDKASRVDNANFRFSAKQGKMTDDQQTYSPRVMKPLLRRVEKCLQQGLVWEDVVSRKFLDDELKALRRNLGKAAQYKQRSPHDTVEASRGWKMLKWDGRGGHGGEYNLRVLDTAFPLLNFTIVYPTNPERPRQVYFGWGTAHGGGSSTQVFYTTHKGMVHYFESWFELLKHATPCFSDMPNHDPWKKDISRCLRDIEKLHRTIQP